VVGVGHTRCEGGACVGVKVCDRVLRGDVRVRPVGVVLLGEGLGSLDCGDAERRGDIRLDSHGNGGTRAWGGHGGKGRASSLRPTTAGDDVPLELSEACKRPLRCRRGERVLVFE